MKKWLKRRCDSLVERLTLYAYSGVKGGLARLHQMGVDDHLRSLQACGDGVCLQGSVTLLAPNQLVLGHHVEPPRDCRRRFGLSYAAMGTSSSMA